MLHNSHLPPTLHPTPSRRPTALVFRALRLFERVAPVTNEQWTRATPIFTKLSRAADISYQPAFNPTFEKAFVYLANPERLQVRQRPCP